MRRRLRAWSQVTVHCKAAVSFSKSMRVGEILDTCRGRNSVANPTVFSSWLRVGHGAPPGPTMAGSVSDRRGSDTDPATVGPGGAPYRRRAFRQQRAPHLFGYLPRLAFAFPQTLPPARSLPMRLSVACAPFQTATGTDFSTTVGIPASFTSTRHCRVPRHLWGVAASAMSASAPH